MPTFTGDNNNNTLTGSSGDDLLFGLGGGDILIGGGGGDLLDGGNGTDFASYSDALAGIIASLFNPSINTGIATGDTYVSIEGLIGSSFNDTLIGDAQDNRLRGGAGADVLNGGDGFDFADYSSSSVGLTVDLSNSANNTGEAAGDTFISIEDLIGSAFNDTLVGDAGDNRLRGGAGADVLNGRDGFDNADYSNAAAGVRADLSNSATNTGEAAGDTYISIEALRGSDFNDTLIGDNGDNVLRGRGGADILNGQGGFDLADYRDAATGLTVDLTNAANNTGDAAGDTLISIEALRGSFFNDTLVGDNNNNTLRGGGGADVLNGQGGNDFASYQDATSGVIADLSNTANNTGDAAGDIYISIESLRGSAFNDTLIGDAQSNFLRGGGGADILNGGGGFDYADYSNSTVGLTVDLSNPTVNNTGDAAGDTFISIEALIGSAFNDTLVGNAQDDWLRGGAGADVLNGKEGYDWVDYFGAAAGVRADLSNSATNTGDAAGDLYFSIEALSGSNFNDTLVGDDGDNVLRGRGGADILDGRGGFDLADYRDAFSGVTVDMLNNANNTGEAFGDTLISIENLRGGAFNDTLVGDNNNNTLRGLAGADVLNGQGGIDYASYQDATSSVVADLFNTANNTGDAAGDTYISIEGLRGGAFNDTLVGNNSDNFLRGGAGADVLNGQGGHDFAEYRGATTGIVASLANSSINTGEAAGDTYISIEGLRGSDHSDLLVGLASGGSTILGFSGSDVIYALGTGNTIDGGADTDAMFSAGGGNGFNGGDGFDYVRYDYGTTGVFASLANFAANTGAAAGDSYISVEALVGTSYADTLVGNQGGNELYGGSGADYMYGLGGNDLIFGGDGNDNLEGDAGADALDGGAGFDFARYDYATTGVVVVLNNAAYNTGEAAGDTYTSIEGVVGSAHADIIFGDDAGNQIYGQAGNDFLLGGGGSDALFGGLGVDELRGDAGDDAFFFYASELQAGTRDVIDDFSATTGNRDAVNLIGINPGSVTFRALATGTEIEIALGGGGVATIFLVNASLDAVQAGSFFY